VYRQLDNQLLGWKWRAYPPALAVARISLKTLPHRLKSYAANRDELADRIAGLEGIELTHNYPKSKGSELFGGLRFLYDPDAFGGLTAERFCEALHAEGVPMQPGGFRTLEHLRAVYTQDLPGLWGPGHVGPADRPLPRYRKGDYPVTERLFDGRILQMAGWIEAEDGLIAQVAEGIVKVAEGYRDLL
jgi:dTDP-4-amino-4,6-dideoxygalactose transaminase